MKKLPFILLLLLVVISMSVQAQSHYDYMDDSAVAGGVNSALNFFVVLLFLAIAFIVITIISGIIYGFNPQKEIDKQKREKAEREIVEKIKNRLEKIKIEQEHKKTLLALPEKTIHLIIEGKPHLVGLSKTREIVPEMITTCLWTINKITENGTDITNKVSYFNKDIGYIYGQYYKSLSSESYPLGKLNIYNHFIELANKSKVNTFEIELTINGDFEPQKLQIIHHMFLPSIVNIKQNLFFLEFVMYDGFIIQTHLTNGNSMTFPRTKDFPLHLLLFNNKAALH